MSFHARRRRDEELDQERALLAMRDVVVAATTAYMPWAGSSATLDAVDEALAQLVAAGAHLGEADEVKARWIKYARCRLIDEQRSAEAKHRHRVAIDDEAHAHALSVCGDVDELSEERQLSEARRDLWRVREILSVLRGEQRKWAKAWYREISGPRKPGVQPQGLHEVLGWTQSKTEKTAQRARAKMVSFIQQRQAGEVCAEQQALLDGFITARRDDLGDHEPYEAVVIHLAGCEACFAAWQARRRSLLGHLGAVILVPYDSVVGAAHALAGKVAAGAAGAQGAALSLLQRVGIGGGTVVVGGIAATSAKTAAVCATLVCAALAGVGEITGVLPPIAPSQKHSAAKPAARATQPVARAATKPTAPTLPPALTPPPPPPARKAQHTTASASRPRFTPTRTTSAPPPPPAAASTRRFTPGDLPPAGSSAATAPPASSSPTRPPSSTSRPSCVPGDLNC